MSKYQKIITYESLEISGDGFCVKRGAGAVVVNSRGLRTVIPVPETISKLSKLREVHRGST